MDRFAEVTNGVFRGGQPSSAELVGLRDLFGINKIVSLDQGIANKIKPICEKLNLKQLILPLESNASLDRHLQFLKDNIVEILGNNGPTFIHCYHGKDRTGLAIALFRIKAMGWKPINAWKEAKEYNFAEGLSPQVTKKFEKLIFEQNEDTNDDSDQIVGGLTSQFSFAPEINWAPFSSENWSSANPNTSTSLPASLINNSNPTVIPALGEQFSIPNFDISQGLSPGSGGWASSIDARQSLPWTMT